MSIRRSIAKYPARVLALALAVVLVGAVIGVGVAFSSTGVVQPTGTVVVPGDANGNPVATTLTVAGFPTTTSVFVEQCDGKSPSSLGWDPTVDCDFGASPSPAVADSTGTATFPSNDSALAFTAFKGESPFSLFNCLAPHQLDPGNGLKSWRNCSLRFSSEASSTLNQVFVNIVLPDAPVTAGTTAAFTGSCSGAKAVATVKTATTGAGLTDQTQDVTITGALMRDTSVLPSVAVAGTCTGLVNSHYTNSAVASTTQLGALHPTAVSLALKGSSSCAWNAPAVGADATKSQAYPLSGTLNITFAELSGIGTAHFTLSAAVQLTHDLDGPDLWDVSGRVMHGLSMGAKVAGSLYMDPVSRYGGSPTNVTSNVGYVPPQPWPAGYTGYTLDVVSGNPNGCNDGVANNTHSPAILNAVVVRADPRVDSVSTHAATVTSGSSTVQDASITSGAQGHVVSGIGIPANTTISSVTPGVSFVMNHPATAGGTSATIHNVAVSSGSATVLDAAITAGDVNQPVSGAGIPANTTISSVTAGVSFVMNHPATANGTTATIGAATVSPGSAVVLDSRITAGDTHKPVSGAGIPAGSFVGSVTPGVSFTLSKSDTAQVDQLGTATGHALTITTTPARNIKAQTGVVTYQVGDGISPLFSTASGLSFNF